MHQTQSHFGKSKHLKRKKGFVFSVKGVSRLIVRAKRRVRCKLQLWMWRKWREKWGFGIIRAKKKACGLRLGHCLSLRAPSQKNKRKIPPICHTDVPHASASAAVPTLACDSEIKEETLRGQSHLLNTHGLSQYSAASRSSDTNGPAGATSKTMPSQRGGTSGAFIKTAKPSKRSHTVNPGLSTASEACAGNVGFPSGQCTPVGPDQDKASNVYSDERLTSNKASHTDVSFKALTKEIHEFLDEFYRIYGSFTPLQKSDLLRYLKRKFTVDFNDRKNFIFSEVTRYRSATAQKPVPRFRVVYKKHTLTLDDLSTLADQNWLNDQVMNMYGELIVESAHHKVHFLNSFFHRQLMTKGYDGVKRWTKQVDLFSKSLLLVPIHLVVHWCLVTADFVRKKICLYDSQGNALQKVARNILKYLTTEAKEKQRTAFENGWTVSFDEKIPQQTNENDCGVFVLEYSRCLALEKPLQFSQEDIPKIRKRIYKELCDCKLHEEGRHERGHM